jgi:hypothetical protein
VARASLNSLVRHANKHRLRLPLTFQQRAPHNGMCVLRCGLKVGFQANTAFLMNNVHSLAPIVCAVMVPYGREHGDEFHFAVFHCDVFEARAASLSLKTALARV